jgi:hypothetical protein
MEDFIRCTLKDTLLKKRDLHFITWSVSVCLVQLLQLFLKNFSMRNSAFFFLPGNPLSALEANFKGNVCTGGILDFASNLWNFYILFFVYKFNTVSVKAFHVASTCSKIFPEKVRSAYCTLCQLVFFTTGKNIRTVRKMCRLCLKGYIIFHDAGSVCRANRKLYIVQPSGRFSVTALTIDGSQCQYYWAS